MDFRYERNQRDNIPQRTEDKPRQTQSPSWLVTDSQEDNRTGKFQPRRNLHFTMLLPSFQYMQSQRLHQENHLEKLEFGDDINHPMLAVM